MVTLLSFIQTDRNQCQKRKALSCDKVCLPKYINHIWETTKNFKIDVPQTQQLSKIAPPYWAELLKFSRRTEYSMNKWAARYGYKHDPKEIMENAKKGGNGRYACVNITNWNTIEFRIFRGTLKANTIIATLELVDKVCDLALYLTDKEIANVSWTTFVKTLDATKHKELIAYLKERQLYVNDPIDFMEDD